MVESFVRSAFARIGVGIIKRMPAFKCFQEVRYMRLSMCPVCGKLFERKNKDSLYCEDCARKIKSNIVRKKICQDCGCEFYGYPRSKRCVSCEREEEKKRRKRYREKGAARKIGSSAICEKCGKTYIVRSGIQKYCPDCAREASLEQQRTHKRETVNKEEYNAKRRERRKQKNLVCNYCLRKFDSDTPKAYCSDYCRKEQNKISMCMSDIRRGKERDIQKYLDKRERYRIKVKQTPIE